MVAVPRPRGLGQVLEKVGARLRKFYDNRFALNEPVQHTDTERQVILIALQCLDAALEAPSSENLESARDPDTGILRADLAAVAERVYERLFAELRQRGIILPGCDTTDKALVVIEQWAQAELSPKSAREIVGKNMMQALREQHQIDKAQRRCQHLWPHTDRPMPASWSCACGTKVYRSYEDAVDD